MPIHATSRSSDFELPAEGLHNCVCVDVEDLGLVESTYNGQLKVLHKAAVTFMSDQKQKNGKNALISKRYTLSTHPKSNLRQDIKGWRGKDMTEQEAKEFDVESLIGKTCQVIVSHIEADGKVFSRLEKILKPSASAPKVEANGYTRKVNRPDYQTPQGVMRLRASMNNGASVATTKSEPSWSDYDVPPPQLEDSEDDLPF